MIRILRRALTLMIAAAAGSGCSAPGLYMTYTGPLVAGGNVELECRQAFQVFDRASDHKMLVKPYPAAEAAYVTCVALSEKPFVGQRVRAGEAAKKWLVDGKRETCTVTGVSELTLADYEVTYTCPTPPAAPVKATAKPART